ncbi:aminopeptidase N [Salinisphaera sp. USBA-960]|uniref:aminopeptidase N n=1 Tax=Salinisphaera orenii TaxID=856731 RepID=UPI000DBE87C3|nr:aminopeptidase N [Salifodinibacter halophilus]NNC25867.1 aminopeptidase N [Salifodinibacter halophilus]
MSDHPERKYRTDYRAPDHQIEHADLAFEIDSADTRVTARYQVSQADEARRDDLWLDGHQMTLESIAIDGEAVSDARYAVHDEGLWVFDLPRRCELELVVRIDPSANTALEGLYQSGSVLCTQCEATGFSRIVYFPDRPDVMTRFTTRVTADAAVYPVLLAGGDRASHQRHEDGRHTAVFIDPWPKPCYLFALVAGDLAEITDSYRTNTGHDVELAFYTEHGAEDQCNHAIASLKQAMAWDEATYGLTCDLNRYSVVAVDSFNMGAMENKGLNVFNTACVLARADTATDADFARVRDVVAHEYFHNYTGNRVTCRDWFQLSLKEGLTVFREHQFAADQGSPGVARIQQVRTIRDLQFPEDDGPHAHPVRPESYVEMNNFYTVTVYEKGAELIRMMASIAGREAFNQAVRFYLDKHDGRAVTIEDFVVAIEEATGLDLAQFRAWYAYAGTPTVSVRPSYDNGQLTLELEQSVPATPDQANKPPFDIPIELAFFATDADSEASSSTLRRLTHAHETWRFEGFDAEPTVSLLRGMSAPVRLDHPRDDATLAHLARVDTDPVSRWDALQTLFLNQLSVDVDALKAGGSAGEPSAVLVETVAAILEAPPADHALAAEMLTLPSTARIGDATAPIDPIAVAKARRNLKQQLSQQLRANFETILADFAPAEAYAFNAEAAGRRHLFATALDYYTATSDGDALERALAVFYAADNQTDRMAALSALNDHSSPQRQRALADFAARFADYPLVMDKYRALQAGARRDDSIQHVRALLADPALDNTNPNRIRSILSGFARGNPEGFHCADGSGYQLLGDEIERLDTINPQLAAALAGLLAPWRRYAEPYAGGMRAQLERLAEIRLSDNSAEIVQTALAS